MGEPLAPKKMSNVLATVVENESPQGRTAPREGHESETESQSGSVIEKDGASASGSSSSEELLYVDESGAGSKNLAEVVSASSPFGPGRSARLPPRPPPAADPEVETVLPSQPSIVRRMQEANKHDVDPKDARNLLPSVLLNSGSLDLDGLSEEGATFEKKLQEERLLNLLRQNELERLLLAQQQRQQQELLLAAASGLDLEVLRDALNEQCRVSPPQMFQTSQFQPQQPVANNLLLQQMFPRPGHRRTLSEPATAFAGGLNSVPAAAAAAAPFRPTPPPVEQPVTMADDALAFLRQSNLTQPDWMTHDLQLPGNSGAGLLSMPSPTTVPQEMPVMENNPTQRRRRHGPSKSVDFNVLMKQSKNRNNSSSSRERHPPLSPSTGSKPTTRAEVKKMVEYQASLGRPTYAPWFRDRSNRNNIPRDGEPPAEMPAAGHNRTHSLPHVRTSPGSPEKKQDSELPTPSSGRVGTGVFFPRMPAAK